MNDPADIIDHENPKANMFGLLPCPNCGDTHRWPTRADHPKHPVCIVCDHCGRVVKDPNPR